MIPFQFRTLGCAGLAAWRHVSVPMTSTSFSFYIYIYTPWRSSRRVGSFSQEPLNSPTYSYYSRASAKPNPHPYRVAVSMIDVSVVLEHHLGDRYVLLNDS